ncbi:hypothetical protein MTO96_051088, partial [Rhipicephalus appendiculatus]
PLEFRCHGAAIKGGTLDASPLDKERHRRLSAPDGWFPIHAARVLHSGAWSSPPPEREPQSHLPGRNRLDPWLPERSCCFAPAPSISSSTAAGAPRRTFGPVGGLLGPNLYFIARRSSSICTEVFSHHGTPGVNWKYWPSALRCNGRKFFR